MSEQPLGAYRANHSQRRLLRAVLRGNSDQWFYVTPRHVELERGALVLLGECDEDELELRLSWEDTGKLKDTFNEGPLPTIQRLELTRYTWAWAEGRGWYPEVPECPECAFVHIPVLTEHMLVEIMFGAKRKGYIP